MRCPKCGAESSITGQRRCAGCGAQVGDAYAVSPAALEVTAQPPSHESPYAGFWRRAGGYIIDYLLLTVSLPMLVGITALAMPRAAPSLALLVYSAGIWLYYALMESSSRQATLGKLAVGVKVTDEAGERIGFGRATGRIFAHLITSMTLGIGYVMAAFTARRQTLHDMIAGTLVVRRPFSAAEVADAGPAPAVPAWIPIISVLAFLLFGTGILAAIAIPAYQDYTIRAQVAEGVQAARPYQAAIAAAVGAGQPIQSLSSRTLTLRVDESLRYVDAIKVESGVVVISFGRSAHRAILGKTLLLIPGADRAQGIVWICGHHAPPPEVSIPVQNAGGMTTVADKYLPVACRGSG